MDSRDLAEDEPRKRPVIRGEVTRRAALQIGSAAVIMSSVKAGAMTAGRSAEVLILGAGISGLHAARLLEAQGISVQVIEGSSRVGGRCWTKRDIQGRPELGAQQVGADYGRVRGNAGDLGVELVSPPKGSSAETHLPQMAISIAGAPPTSDWATSAQNRLRDDERSLSPLALLSHYLLKDDPLHDLQDWRKPAMAPVDAMSLDRYLVRQGASEEAVRLIGVVAPVHSLNQASALDVLRKQHYYAFSARTGPYHLIRDGTDALTTAMAKSLKQPVLLDQVVAHIDVQPEHVTVTCKNGERYTARACISTIPPTVFHTIPLTVAPPVALAPLQRTAWNRVELTHLVQVFFNVRAPFWETDGLPATMWTDGPAKVFIHAPSLVDPMGSYYAYINGAGADPFEPLSDAQTGAIVMNELLKRRPAAAGKVTVSYIHRWATYPFSKGHIAYHQPGDITRYGAALAQPVGALHFAGEHLALTQAGIEGACESAENTVLAVLATLGKA